jgi:integrase
MNKAAVSLDELINGFIRFKRSIGYSYDTEVYYLNRFKQLCEKHGCYSIPGKAEFLEWMARKPGELPQTQYTRLSPIRQLHSYICNTVGGISFNLPKSVRSHGDKYRPHFLRDEEASLFFFVCDALKARKENPCRETVLPVAFRLVYCCGLRPIEAIKLKTADVNLEIGYIDIIASKNHKDRRLFISGELIDYLSEYDREINLVWPNREYFFPKGLNGRYADDFLGTNFRRIWQSALGGCAGGRVRLYDMRHHFAFANINRWVREGKDANSMIVYLSKYMGHSSIECTYYYMHLVPEYFRDYAGTVRVLSDILPEVEYED